MSKTNDDDEVVVFNADAYSVVASWISKDSITEEDEVNTKHKKPLYTKSQSLNEEDKFLSSKILNKKRYNDTRIKEIVQKEEDIDIEDDLYQEKGKQLNKKQKIMNSQDKLLQTLRMEQEKRKNKKKNKK